MSVNREGYDSILQRGMHAFKQGGTAIYMNLSVHLCSYLAYELVLDSYV